MAASLATDTVAAGAAFFRWWGGELAAMLPPGLVRRLRTRPSLILDWSESGATVRHIHRGEERVLGRTDGEGEQAQLRQAVAPLRGARRRTIVRLAAACCSRGTVLLPAAAAGHLRSAIALQLSRFTPFNPDEVAFACRIIGREGEGTIRVALTIVPVDILQAALTTARNLGLRPTRVVMAGADPADPAADLMGADPAAGGWRRLDTGLLAVVIILAAAAAWAPLHQRAARLSDLEERIEAVRPAALAAGDAERQLDRRVQDRQFLADLRRQRTQAVDVLLDLTRHLPDGSWLTHLDLDGDRLTLTGYSDAASRLLGQLQATPLFDEAAFRSPVSFDDRMGAEAFQLSVRVGSGPTKAAALGGRP